MANNINREGFKRFLELGAPSFEGNIILDSGELSEYYYRFMRIPLAYGEHKVDVLYGQRFYGTCECEEWRQGNAGSNVPASDTRNPCSVLPSV